MDDTASTGPRRRKTRRILIGLAVLAGLVVLAVVGPLVALRFRSVRLATFERVAAAVEQNARIRLSATDVRLRLLEGAVEIEGAELRNADVPATAFLTVSSLRARLDWRSLFGARPIVRELRASGVRLDLGASLPRPAARPGQTRRAVSVLQLEIEDGTVIGPPVPDSAEPWLDAWRLERISATGSWAGGVLELQVAGGRAVVESGRRPPIAAEIVGRLTIAADGAVTVAGLRARSGDLQLEAHGGRSAGPAAPWQATFHADARIGRLFPDIVDGGQLDARGDLRLTSDPAAWRIEGSVEAQVEGTPAPMLTRWLPAAVAGRLDLRDSSLDAVAKVEIDVAGARAGAEPVEPRVEVAGTGELTWRRGAETLVTASVRTAEADVSCADCPLDLSVEARILPGSRDARRLDARIVAPGWPALAAGRFERLDVELDASGLEHAIARLRLPFVLPLGLRPAGAVTARLEIDRRSAPAALRLDTTWRHLGETLLTVVARTEAERLEPPSSRQPLRVGFEVALLPDLDGRRQAAGELLLTGPDLSTQGRLEGTRIDIAMPDAAPIVHRLEEHLHEIAAGDTRWDLTGRLGAWRGLLTGEIDLAVDLSGPLGEPDVRLAGDWRATQDETVGLTAHGRVTVDPPGLAGPVALDVVAEGFDLSRLPFGAEDAAERPLAGIVSGSLSAAGVPERFTGRVVAHARDLRLGPTLRFAVLDLDAESDGARVELRSVSGVVERIGSPQIGGAFTASGFADAAWPPREIELRLEFLDPVAGAGRTTATARLDGGVLRVDPIEPALSGTGKAATFGLELPLGALAPLPGVLASLPQPDGPMRISVRGLALASALAFVAPQRRLPDLNATIDGALALDPRDPLAAEGAFEVTNFAAGPERRPVLEAEVLRIDVASRLVRLSTQARSGLAGTAPLEISGAMRLAERWEPGATWSALVTDLRLDAAGSIDASILGPYVAGGLAEGPLTVAFEMQGPLDGLTAELRAHGDATSLLYASPYLTKFEAPDIVIRARPGEAVIERARGRLNGGDFELSGSLTTADGLQLDAIFAGVHYRLDYGASVQLRGALQLAWPPYGRRRLSGDLVVERASLRRRVELDREILRVLFEPQLQMKDTSVLETIDLDIGLTTDDGLRIRNNLADLHADWGRIDVGGTLAEPLLAGTVDLAPGGRLFLIGQTLRIDEGTLSWAGALPSAPRLSLETTSSLDDPTIAQTWRGDWALLGGEGPGRGGGLDFSNQARQESAQAWESMASGALVHFQDRVVGSVGARLETTHISYEPLPLFGETDTQARYTIAQDLSPNLSFIASSNPREAEAQTYILDVHAVPVAPSLRGQAFRNDADHLGATIQQTVRLGRGAEAEESGPRVRRITAEAPEGISPRYVRRASGFRKGQPFPPGSRLDVEIDVAEALRRKGWPASRVDVSTPPVDDGRIDLHISVGPGPRVSVVFEGEKLPGPTRRAIGALYRTDEALEQLSVEELRAETVRALRSQGYLDPQAVVTVSREDDGDRNVRVSTLGGRKVDPAPPIVFGLPEVDARAVSERFAQPLGRVELAAGTPEADARFLDAVRAQGYAEARIVARELSADGKTLRLWVEPGPQATVAALEVTGVTAEESARLAAATGLAPGDVLRLERLSSAAHAVEDELRAAGHADSRVRTVTSPASDARPHERLVRFDVVPGPRYRIDDVSYEGLDASSRAWVEKTTGLEAGRTYNRQEIAEARGRLYQTGVFQRIAVATDDTPLPSVLEAPLADEVVRSVTFELEEKKRYQIGYGLRWESDVGLGVVAEALDRNSLGRGHTSGVRAIYGANEQSLRFYHLIPRIVGPRTGLELFLEGKKESVEGLDIEGVEAWGQLTFPLTRRTRNRIYAVLEASNTTAEMPDPDEPLDDRVISPRLGWQIVFDTRERTLTTPRAKGLFLGLDISGASTALGSELTVLSQSSQLALFLPLGRSRFTWAQSYRIGSRDAAGTTIPTADRLRVGGEYSVRGYPRDSLGPLDAEGNALGGEVSLILNQELIARLARGLSGLAFFDAGNVWATRRDLDSELFRSWGFGLRYQSPIGPLRLDYAIPLNRREGIDPAYKIYFGFGETF